MVQAGGHNIAERKSISKKCLSPSYLRGRQPGAPEVVVQEVHLKVQPVGGARVERPAQVLHDGAARHLVHIARQHHVALPLILVQDVLRRVQPLVRLPPPAEGGQQW